MMSNTDNYFLRHIVDMGSTFSYSKLPSHHVYQNETELLRMEQVALSYCSKVNGNPNRTFAIEISCDEDIRILMEANPINQIDVLLLYGISSERMIEEERLTIEGIRTISSIVKQNKSIKMFGFIRNPLNKEMAKVLCDVILCLPSIEYVSFQDTGLYSELVDYIINQIKYITTLREINMEMNPFQDGEEKEKRLRKEGCTFRWRYDY